MVFCSVIGCMSRGDQKDNDVTFHAFPEDKYIRNAWIKFTGCPNLKPTADTYMCSKHFQSSRFRKMDKSLNPKAIPTLFEHKPIPSTKKYTRSPTQPTEMQAESKLPAVMEEREWPLSRLETFASAYNQHEILYSKPSSMQDTAHHKLNKEFALERLAGTLGLPNDHAMSERCREFRHQLLCYVRRRVRLCAFRNEDPDCALAGAPVHVAELSRKMDLVRVAIFAELSRQGGLSTHWVMNALRAEMLRAARQYCGSSGAWPVASEDDTPIPRTLWLRLRNLRLQQLTKLALLGDRNEALSPSERLDSEDWKFADTLILDASDEDLPLITEMMLHGRESLRSLVTLVELMEAATELRPRTHATSWRSVHASYLATGRSASLLLLQRRWHRLRQMSCVLPRPLHPLLQLVFTSFRQVAKKPALTWQTLIHHRLVVAEEEFFDSEPSVTTLAVDLSELNNCKTTTDIVIYVENKLLSEHNLYFTGTCWKVNEAVDVPMIELNDPEADAASATANRSAGESTETAMDSDDEAASGVSSDEDEYPDEPPREPKNKENYVEIEIDMSKIVDYAPDVATESGNEILGATGSFRNGSGSLKCSRWPRAFDKKRRKAGRPKSKNAPAGRKSISPQAKSIRNYKKRSRRPSRRDRGERKGRYEHVAQDDDDPLRPRTYIDLDEESESERNDAIDRCLYDGASRNPDLNPALKRLPRSFWKVPNNRRSMSLCRPVEVRLQRLRETDVPRNESPEGVARAVTSQPPSAASADHRPYYKAASGQRAEALARQARVKAQKLLDEDIEQLNVELARDYRRRLRTTMVIASVKDEDSNEVDAIANFDGRCDTAPRRRGDDAADVPAVTGGEEAARTQRPTEWEKKGTANDSLEPNPGAVCGQAGDLDNLLQCTIITKPAGYADAPMTDVATRPFFVGSDEPLLGSDFDPPIITGVCSLAEPRPENPTIDAAGDPRAWTQRDAVLTPAPVDAPPATSTRPPTPSAATTYQINNPKTSMTSPTPNTIPSKAPVGGNSAETKTPISLLEKALKRLKRSKQDTDVSTRESAPMANGAGTTRLVSAVLLTECGRKTRKVAVVPRRYAVRMDRIASKDAPQNSPPLPKQYERFSNTSSGFASLTPILMRNARTTTRTNTKTVSSAASRSPADWPKLAPALPRLRPIREAVVPVVTKFLTTSAFRPQAIPTIAVGSQILEQVPPKLLPKITLAPMSSANASQLVPALRLTAPFLAPQLVGVTPMTSSTNSTAPHVLPTLVAPRTAVNALKVTTALTPIIAPELLPIATPIPSQMLDASAAQKLPTLNMPTPLFATSTPRVVPVAITSRMSDPSAPQTRSASTMTSLQTDPPELAPVSENTYTIGSIEPAEDVIILKLKRDTSAWVEPGRVDPPCAFVLNRYMTPKDYCSNYRSNPTIIKLDSSKPLWTVAEEYVILTEKKLPCRDPTYWTTGPLKTCARLLWPPDWNDSDDADGDGDRPTLTVRSFAKFDRMEKNTSKDRASNPDVVEQFERHYKKLTDNPLRYALMLTAVSSMDECDGLIRERVPLHVWDRRTGGLSPLEVSVPLPEQPPTHAGVARAPPDLPLPKENGEQLPAAHL